MSNATATGSDTAAAFRSDPAVPAGEHLPEGVAPLPFTFHRNTHGTSEATRRAIQKDPGFGVFFTDHMVEITWTEGIGWHDAELKPYGPISLDPAAAVLHYGQEVFEGLKAYRHEDGSVWTFRPQRNAARINNSAARLALPRLPQELFLAAVEQLVGVDSAWVPNFGEGEKSLYLRPFMIGTEKFLGVRPSQEVKFYLIASPAGTYFAGGVHPVSIWLEQDTHRTAPGGTGFAKCGGNYAASLVAEDVATAHGCDQVCFLDSEHNTYIEELGGMNVMFVRKDGTIVTPELTGTILEGITRSSLIDVARSLGHEVEERRVSGQEWRDGVTSGDFAEVFACGTAAVITPIGTLVDKDGTYTSPNQTGEVTMELRNALLDLQYGRTADDRGWTYRLV